MDKVWDSLASQVVFGDVGAQGTTVEERHAKATKLKALREERDETEARCRKERQFTRKKRAVPPDASVREADRETGEGRD